MTLAEMKVGGSGTITAVGGEGPLRLRFLDMGLIPRTKVSVVKSRRWATRSKSASGGTS